MGKALADALLAGARSSQTSEPFFHFEVEDFLPSQQYQELLTSFPKEGQFPERIKGNKLRLNSRTTPEAFTAFCEQSPAWPRFFEELETPEFIGALYEIVARALRRSRGVLESRPWQVGDISTSGSGISPIGHESAFMSFEFSRLENGASVKPHTDGMQKLVSLILYFADPAWREEYGGDTLYYRPKRAAHNYNWKNRWRRFEQLEPVFENRFAPNRLAVFVKSSNSYHGVPPITCPDGMARNSLNIHVFQHGPGKPGPLIRLRNTIGRLLPR